MTAVSSQNKKSKNMTITVSPKKNMFHYTVVSYGHSSKQDNRLNRQTTQLNNEAACFVISRRAGHENRDILNEML